MATTLAFDVYGTLINTHGVVSLLENMVGDNARAFSLGFEVLHARFGHLCLALPGTQSSG